MVAAGAGGVTTGKKILPGTGRGAMRSMVEGVRNRALRQVEAPLHPAASLHGPSPRAGEEQ